MRITIAELCRKRESALISSDIKEGVPYFRGYEWDGLFNVPVSSIPVAIC
jgi:hypothetical protein